jgi:hypothetical protein
VVQSQTALREALMFIAAGVIGWLLANGILWGVRRLELSH